MCFAIEPMINLGTEKIYTKNDKWTVCTQDGLPSAHFEHTIVITKNGNEILTKYNETNSGSEVLMQYNKDNYKI